ncbi:MAG: hypothetical protein AB1586_24270 [Pseudomonadota bacterium]
MADPRNLRVKVQADRLPDVGSKAQVAVRVSAVIDGTEGVVLTALSVKEILPWLWRKQDGTPHWNPHDPAAWKFWNVGAGGAATIQPVTATVTAAVIPPANFDGTGRFGQLLQEEIDSIVAASGLEATLCIPAGAAELSGRTVFGMVESLTGLPHPVGAGMNVFSVFTIDPAPLDLETKFFAAPLFGPSNGGVYDLDTAPPSIKTDVNGTFYRVGFVAHTGTTTMFPTGSVDMRPSLSWSEIAPADDAERLIDMATMLVKKPKEGNGLADNDWAASLSRRISEVVDPFARVVGVLDAAVTSAITDPATGSNLRRVIAEDLARIGRTDPISKMPLKPSLLAALDSIAWSVVGDRVAASPVAAPPAASLLQGLASRQTDFWDSTAGLILAAADRGAGSVRNDTARARFGSVSSRRLKALIDLPVNPDEGASAEPPSLESDDGVRQFVARHWLGGPDLSRPDVLPPAPPPPNPLPKGATRKIAANLLTVSANAAAIGTAAAGPQQGPLLDLGPVAAAAPTTPTRIGFGVSLVPPAGDFTLTIAFVGPPGRLAPPSVVVTGTAAAPAQLSVTIVVDGTVQSTDSISRSLGTSVTLPVTIAASRAAADGPVILTLAAASSAPVDAARLLGGPFYLSLTAGGADISDVGIVMPDKTATLLRTALDRVTTGPGLRAELALAMIGPYIQGLTSGRLTWDGPQTSVDQDNAKLSLDRRLITSITAFVGAKDDSGARPATSLYDIVLNRALADAGLTGTSLSDDQKALVKLLGEIVEAARFDAVRRAHGLVPAAAAESGDGDDHSRRLTIDAPPLVFRFDQLQSIIGADDLWTRLSGLGVLMSRTSTMADPAAWRSLNVATLHAPKVQQRMRENLVPDNAIKVRAGDWAASSIVDPVALQVGELGGVRSAMISYDNRSIVAEMSTDAGLDTAVSSHARRIEAYRFPPTSGQGATDYRLIALSFGYAFHVLPYVIGQGGTLPPMLRATPEDPLTMRPVGTADALKGQVTIPSTITKDMRRAALYRRTRPIGGPRLARKPPGVPDGVVPLASELPIRPAPVTIGGDIEGRFFVDRDGIAGVLNVRAGKDPGLRIDIGRLEWSTPAGPRQLTLTVRGRKGASQDVVDLLKLDYQVAAVGAMRVEMFAAKTTIASGVAQPTYTEDEFNFGPSTRDVIKPARDIADWRDVQLVIKFDKEVGIEPPVVTPIEPLVRPGYPDVNGAVGKPSIAPEAGHQTREIYVLDGIGVGSPTGPRTMTIPLRRPSLEFGSYERWVNPPLFDPDPTASAGRNVVKRAIEGALTVATTTNATREDRSLDDPAVTQLYAELVRIFPDFMPLSMQPIGPSWQSLEEVLGFDEQCKRHGGPSPSIDVKVGSIKAGDTDGWSGSTATVMPGRIYELRIYAGVPDKQDQLCPLLRDQRLSPAVKATLRHCPVPGAPHASMKLAGPTVMTLEVATETVPEIFGTDPLGIELRRPPELAEHAWIRFTDKFTSDNIYPALRYCHLAALESQRWSWRGRPQDDQWQRPHTDGSKTNYDDQFATAFSDRREDDIGEIFERRIERAHVYGGKDRRSDTAAQNPLPRLFDKSLDWRGGVNFWRFGLRIISRYRAMRPNRPEFMRTSHRRSNGTAVWHNEVVLDRSYDRRPKRPGLALVLPLTERMMAYGTVPPLLAVFNEQLYPNFHAGDGIDVSIEMVRHPFTRKDRQNRVDEITRILAGTSPPTPEEAARLREEQARLQSGLGSVPDSPLDALKYWQQWGPDPIRSGAGAGGEIVPLRVDGPIGYTFDLGTEAGRFDHAGLVISPTSQNVAPWSFMKLRFRRLEAPEGLDPATALTGQGPAPSDPKRFLCAPRHLALNSDNSFRLSNTRDMSAFSPKDVHELADVVDGTPTILKQGIFPTEHEGLVIDIDDSNHLAGSSLRVQFTNGSDDNPWVKVDFSVENGTSGSLLVFTFSTELGAAGLFKLPMPADGKLLQRTVVSAREKPQKGDVYKPAGDVAVQVRVTRDITDRIASPNDNRWLSIACLPLTTNAEIKISDPVTVVLKATGGQSTVSPVRLSPFTPALWCQFAEAMSLFDASIDGSDKPVPVETKELVATIAKNGTKVTVTCTDLAGKPRKLRALAPSTAPGAGPPAGQLEEVLVLVVTRSIHDALDRIQERPVAVKQWDASATTLDLAAADWPAPVTTDDLGDGGSIRFLRILRPKPYSAGGYVEKSPVFPQDFFQFETIEGDVEMNPRDAMGMVLGMSLPIPWTRA